MGRRRRARREKAPSAHEAVAAGGRRGRRGHAGRPAPARAPRRRRSGVDREHDPRRRLREPRQRRDQLGRSATAERRTPPAIAISASATARPPSEQSCTPRDHALARRGRARARAARRRRRGRRPAACRRAGRGRSAHSEPPSSARGRAEHARCASPSCSAGRGGTAVELVDQPDHADDRRRVDVARRATRCRSSRCRRPPGCRARGTPRSCRRRPRRTATSPRGARGCRSSGSSPAPAARAPTHATLRAASSTASRAPVRGSSAAEPRLAVGGERERARACP